MKRIVPIFLVTFMSWQCHSQIDYKISAEELRNEMIESLTVLQAKVKAHQSESTVTFVYATDLHNKILSAPYAKGNAIIRKISNIEHAVNMLDAALDFSCVVLGVDYIWNTNKTPKGAAIDALEVMV